MGLEYKTDKTQHALLSTAGQQGLGSFCPSSAEQFLLSYLISCKLCFLICKMELNSHHAWLLWGLEIIIGLKWVRCSNGSNGHFVPLWWVQLRPLGDGASHFWYNTDALPSPPWCQSTHCVSLPFSGRLTQRVWKKLRGAAMEDCPETISPEVCSNSCPLSRWHHLAISSSVAPFF